MYLHLKINTLVAFTSEEFVAVVLFPLSPAGQPLFCRATRAHATMPHEAAEPGPRSTSRSDECIDLSSPTSCAPKTTNQSSPSVPLSQASHLMERGSPVDLNATHNALMEMIQTCWISKKMGRARQSTKCSGSGDCCKSAAK